MSDQMLNADVDSLLDSTLDDLADLPEFKAFPAGMHKVGIKFEVKKIGDKTGIEMAMKYIEPLELADAAEVPPKAGDTSNVVYFLDNELGQGQFKNIMLALRPTFGETLTNRQLMEAAANAEVAVVTKQRKDKNDATKVYTQVTKLEVI